MELVEHMRENPYTTFFATVYYELSFLIKWNEYTENEVKRILELAESLYNNVEKSTIYLICLTIENWLSKNYIEDTEDDEEVFKQLVSIYENISQ